MYSQSPMLYILMQNWMKNKLSWFEDTKSTSMGSTILNIQWGYVIKRLLNMQNLNK